MTYPTARPRLRPRGESGSLLRETRGASLTEYLIVVGLVGLVAIGGFRKLGHAATGKADRQADRVANLEGEPSTGGSDWVVPFGAHGSDKKKGVNLTAIDKPDPKLPDPYNHPEKDWLQRQMSMDGKCGITGVANMLRFYGVEKEPKDIDRSEYRSVGPGMRADKFRDNMKELSGKDFEAKTIPDGTDALGVLRGHLNDGKPVAIQYMTSPTDAHWVIVTGVRDTAGGPVLTVQSWGGWHEVKWPDIDSNWKRGYGGPYPYVVGTESSPNLPKVPPKK